LLAEKAKLEETEVEDIEKEGEIMELAQPDDENEESNSGDDERE